MDEPKLSVEDRGEGSPALVFLHYFAGSSRSWRHVVDQAANACRCVRLDVPGFGGSPPLTAYSVHGVAQAIGAAITPLRLQSYALVGHSMGGKLALAMAPPRPPVWLDWFWPPRRHPRRSRWTKGSAFTCSQRMATARRPSAPFRRSR